MRSDVIVIGSGISGLTAAAILARKGKKVTVIEKKRHAGGALRRFSRRGVSFDVGFHYTGCLGEGQILHRLWNFCQVLPHLSIHKFPAYGADRLYLRNGTRIIDAFFSYEYLQQSLLLNFPREKEGIRRYFDTLRAICDTIPFYNMEKDLSAFLSSFRQSPLSVEHFIRSITDDPELQAVLASPSLLYGVPTDNVSLDVHAMVAHGYLTGAYTIAGGGQGIVDAFLKTCKTAGVDIITSSEVTSITADKTGVKGVITDKGDEIQADQVIFAAHPTLLLPLVPAGLFRPVYRKRLLQLKNSWSMNIFFGTISEKWEFLNWHNHVILPDGPNPYRARESRADSRFLMFCSTERETFNLQAKNKNVILLQPEPWKEVKEYVNSTPYKRPQGYLNHKRVVRDRMLEQLYEQLGHSTGKLNQLAFATPLTFRDELSACEGCAYGASHSLDQMTPDIRTRIPGLFLSGQSTLMTGIVGSSLAGFLSAAYILGLEPLWQELKRCS